MTIHPKGLLVGLLVLAAFTATLLLAVDFRIGVTTGVLAAVAYVVVEAGGMGLGHVFLTGRHRSR